MKANECPSKSSHGNSGFGIIQELRVLGIKSHYLLNSQNIIQCPAIKKDTVIGLCFDLMSSHVHSCCQETENLSISPQLTSRETSGMSRKTSYLLPPY